MGIKGLSGVGADNSTDCTVEVEFLPAQEDSLSYLFMTFEKDGTGVWRAAESLSGESGNELPQVSSGR